MISKAQTSQEGLIQIPFARRTEKHSSARYRWDNQNRGIDSFVIIQYTHRGEGIFSLSNQKYPVPAGSAFIAVIPEESSYYYPIDARAPWEFSWMNFYGELAVQLWKGFRQHHGPVVPLLPSALRLLRHICHRVENRSWSSPYEASESAYRFYLETLRAAPRPRVARPFRNAVAYFHSHYQEQVRIKEIAAFTGMSREHFTRLFTRQMGCGPAAFLRRIRLDASSQLLRTTDLPIAEVALRSGWTSPTKLGLFFRRRYGISPRRYRERSRRRSGHLPAD